MLPTTVAGEDLVEKAALDVYFLCQDGSTFKGSVVHAPYFYVSANKKWTKEVLSLLERRFEGLLASAEAVEKEDLDLPNHLSGLKATYIKLSFRTVSDLMEVRREIRTVVQDNKRRSKVKSAYGGAGGAGGEDAAPDDFFEALTDMREYDVPYYTRVSIDCDVRVGSWYRVRREAGELVLERLVDMMEKAEPRVLAFDIECTKSPLKFPDARMDQVFMISYMFDGQGYLITNREIVSEDIDDFEYTPKPEYPGPFQVFNEANEEALLRRFFDHVKEVKPQIFVTYNGDFFDWPFVEKRAEEYGINMEDEIGIVVNDNGEYRGRVAVHMDAFCWVKRDSYLPQGSQGLKAVTRYKLGYDPVEIDPEDMTSFAASRPRYMASYSVSDAVATYYLYMKYVHNFIFSLCTIIPLGADDVLRKGSGTLCEMLLMVEAYRGNIICPNKQVEPHTRFHEGHLLETETYIGGHVECLEAGVFRADIPCKFSVDPAAYQELIDNVDNALTFALEVEEGIQRSEATNYEEVKTLIVEQLEMLRDTPVREEVPSIYHIDVAAMYPNIILTNRLQPSSIVDESVCAACDFNDESNRCKRRLEWMWRGDYFPATRSEYDSLKAQIEYEQTDQGRFHDLPASEQAVRLKERVKLYSRKVYKRVKDTKVAPRTATICQRENPFYADTVRAFRDRRYEYKGLTKKWAKKKAAAEKAGDALALEEAKARVTLYDSLSLAHKCILNSFYGYVMRKGARWHSMEMAGVVTYTGANLITDARKLVDRIGRPLELDTDGIWCILPGSFPEDFTFKLRNGGKCKISYPCVMVNVDTHDHYTNDQYQTLVDKETNTYTQRNECSIFFEVDGPYKAMVLPASQEEGKLLKKRYAVFDFDGSIAELKGFELKRRGELEIIKIFQEQVFKQFLSGESLESCYDAVADVANYWLDVLHTEGEDLADEELIGLISENRNMTRTLEDYGDQKSTAISTARRLAEFLGSEMVQDKGLNCKLLVARKPLGAPVTERAIPTAIFSAEPSIMKHFLRRWTKDPGLTDFDIRNIVDWDYYITRLNSAVQKIITIPAALQGIANPVPRVEHPEWLQKLVRRHNDPMKQMTLSGMFGKTAPSEAPGAAAAAGSGAGSGGMPDMEDQFAPTTAASKLKQVPRVHRFKRRMLQGDDGVTYEDDVREQQDGVTETKEAGMDDEGGAEGVSAGAGGGVDSEMAPPAGGDVDMDEDFGSWLASRKATWKQTRDRRKRERDRALLRQRDEEFGRERSAQGGSPRKLRPGAGLSGYLQDVSQSISRGYWQILEIRAAATPGEFHLWTMSSPGTLQSVYLVVPRILYVNMTVPDAKSRGARVDRVLPRGRPSLHLYQLQMPERRYVRNNKEFTRSLVDPTVEGVYETKTPLLLRALLALGCVVQVSARHRNRNRRRGDSLVFDLNELEWASTTTHAYLEPRSAHLRRVYIYHSSQDSRGIVGVFQVNETNKDVADAAARAMAEAAASAAAAGGSPARINMAATDAAVGGVDVPVTAMCNVWLINPFRGDSARPRLRRAFEEFNTLDGSAVEFRLLLVRDHRSAWRGVSALLREIEGENRGPAVVLVQSPTPKAALLQLVPPLNDFVTITVPHAAEDSVYPALGWQEFAGRHLVARYLHSHHWWANRVSCARYAHLPVANIGEDVATTMADIFFARQLQHNRHLLWVSPTTLPDVAGYENDNAVLSLLDAYSGQDAASKHENPTVSAPGAYRCVCVDLEVVHLAVNTVLMSQYIGDIEGSDGSLGFDTTGTAAAPADGEVGSGMLALASLDESAACTSAFRILKAMLNNWLRDTTLSGNEYGDLLLQNFYRWLASSSSQLYDPALHRMIHKLMCKVFYQLVAEVRRLGSKVVFASFNRIIIATNKTTLDGARAYADYVVETLKKRPIFQWLVFPVTRYWHSLLFQDIGNFGGIIARTEDDDLEDEAEASGADVRNTGPRGGGAATPAKTPGTPSRARRAPLPVARSPGKASRTLAAKAASDDDGSSDEDIVAYGRRNVGARRKDRVVGGGSDSDSDASAPARKPRKPSIGDSSMESDSEAKSGQKGVKTLSQTSKRVSADSRYDLPSSEDESSDADSDASAPLVRRDRKPPGKGSAAAAAQHLAGKAAKAGIFTVTASDVVSNWNMADYLPAEVGRWLNLVVAEFLLKPAQHRERQLRAALMAESGTKHTQITPSAAALAPTPSASVKPVAVNEDAEAAFLSDLVRDYFTNKLLHLLPTIQLSHGHPEDFPVRPGSHLRLTQPALEFAKQVCHIMALDKTVEEEVSRMRKALMRLLSVREFSKEAQFVDPCLTYVLPDVICAQCLACRDLDLCRDPNIEPGSSEAPATFHCASCGTPYDRDSLEQRLVEIAEKSSMAYQLQDLACSKCHQVKGDYMSEYCPCSGRFVNQESPAAFRERMLPFRNIARAYEFEWLGDTMSTIMQ